MADRTDCPIPKHMIHPMMMNGVASAHLITASRHHLMGLGKNAYKANTTDTCHSHHTWLSKFQIPNGVLPPVYKKQIKTQDRNGANTSIATQSKTAPVANSARSAKHQVNLPDGLIPLPIDYKPLKQDVVCGRGRGFYKCAGNVRFRNFVKQHVESYISQETKAGKMALMEWIVQQAKEQLGCRFIKPMPDGTWCELNGVAAREKVRGALREALSQRNVKKVVATTQKLQNPSLLRLPGASRRKSAAARSSKVAQRRRSSVSSSISSTSSLSSSTFYECPSSQELGLEADETNSVPSLTCSSSSSSLSLLPCTNTRSASFPSPKPTPVECHPSSVDASTISPLELSHSLETMMNDMHIVDGHHAEPPSHSPTFEVFGRRVSGFSEMELSTPPAHYRTSSCTNNEDNSNSTLLESTPTSLVHQQLAGSVIQPNIEDVTEDDEEWLQFADATKIEDMVGVEDELSVVLRHL